MNRKSTTNSSTPLLDEALAELRRAPTPTGRLSDETRATILQAGLETAGPAERPLRTLFVPLRKLVLAGALPVVALTLALGWMARPAVETTPLAAHGTPPVHVTKSGDEVIFLIANGHRPHAVYKSEAANRFDAPPAFWTEDGAFRDRLDAGPDLVFYRID